MDDLSEVDLLLFFQALIVLVLLLQVEDHQDIIEALLDVDGEAVLQKVLHVEPVPAQIKHLLLRLPLIQDLRERHSCYLQLGIVVQQVLEYPTLGLYINATLLPPAI